MPLVKVQSLILHAFPYGDTSRILRILTPDYGLRSIIAKGAQRPKSRFGGLLEPFTQGEAQFNLREGRDLFTLSGFSLVRARQGIGRDFTAFTGASILAELTLRAATEEPDPDLFDTLSATFDSLAATPTRPAATALAAVWHLISHLGFRPELDSCIHCGQFFASDEPSRFDALAGGAACRTCRPTGRLVPASVRHDIVQMAESGDIPAHLDAMSLHRDLLNAFASMHIASDRPLRSLQLFLDQLA